MSRKWYYNYFYRNNGLINENHVIVFRTEQVVNYHFHSENLIALPHSIHRSNLYNIKFTKKVLKRLATATRSLLNRDTIKPKPHVHPFPPISFYPIE